MEEASKPSRGSVSLNLELRWAAQRGDRDEVKALLGEGADIHSQYEAALRDAAAHGHQSTIVELLDFYKETGDKPDPYALDTAVQWAEKKGHAKTAELLKELMDPNFKPTWPSEPQP